MSQMQARSIPEEQKMWNFSAENTDRKVLGFSGKLGSGKSSCKNFLMSMAMTYHLQVDGKPIFINSRINPEGKIEVQTDEQLWEVADIDSRNPDVVQYMNEYVWPFMKPFSCADYLKKFCVDVLKVDSKLIYGSQEDKKKLTDITWNKIPGYTGNKTGRLSGRELMETFGTEIIRHMVSDGWANALKNSILEYGSLYSIVDDLRFPDECEYIKSIGGKIIRLTLTTPESAKNTHLSNVSLDEYDGFDYVIDNQNLSMEDSFRELISILTQWGWFKVIN